LILTTKSHKEHKENNQDYFLLKFLKEYIGVFLFSGLELTRPLSRDSEKRVGGKFSGPALALKGEALNFLVRQLSDESFLSRKKIGRMVQRKNIKIAKILMP
jgi:hypothetical protein